MGGSTTLHPIASVLRDQEHRSVSRSIWSATEMREAFDLLVGPSDVEVDGFFSLNVQPSDLDLMPSRYRALIRFSEWLRGWSRDVPFLRNVAGSLYVRAVVPEDLAPDTALDHVESLEVGGHRHRTRRALAVVRLRPHRTRGTWAIPRR